MVIVLAEKSDLDGKRYVLMDARVAGIHYPGMPAAYEKVKFANLTMLARHNEYVLPTGVTRDAWSRRSNAHVMK